MFDEDANRRRFSNQAVSVTRRLEIGAFHFFACILVFMIMKCPENVHGVEMQNLPITSMLIAE